MTRVNGGPKEGDDIVALHFRRVGDSLLATPAIRALGKRYPACKIHVLVEAGVERVFKFNPWIDEIHVTQSSPSLFALGKHLARIKRPWAILDFHCSMSTAIATYLSGAERRVGVGRRGRVLAYTDIVNGQEIGNPIYTAEHKLNLASVIGATSDGCEADFILTIADSQEADRIRKDIGWHSAVVHVAFFVNSRRDFKRWPYERFGEVIRWTSQEAKAQPILLRTPGDEFATSEVLQHTQGITVPIAETRDIGVLGAVLRGFDILVGNDGGPKHIAVVMGTRTLTVFGEENPAYWTPPNSGLHQVLWGGQDGIGAISSRMVIDKLRQMLEQR